MFAPKKAYPLLGAANDGAWGTCLLWFHIFRDMDAGPAGASL